MLLPKLRQPARSNRFGLTDACFPTFRCRSSVAISPFCRCKIPLFCRYYVRKFRSVTATKAKKIRKRRRQRQRCTETATANGNGETATEWWKSGMTHVTHKVCESRFEQVATRRPGRRPGLRLSHCYSIARDRLYKKLSCRFRSRASAMHFFVAKLLSIAVMTYTYVYHLRNVRPMIRLICYAYSE